MGRVRGRPVWLELIASLGNSIQLGFISQYSRINGVFASLDYLLTVTGCIHRLLHSIVFYVPRSLAVYAIRVNEACWRLMLAWNEKVLAAMMEEEFGNSASGGDDGDSEDSSEGRVSGDGGGRCGNNNMLC